MTCLTAKRLSLVAVASLALGGIAVPAPADAQVRAMLPTIDQMDPLQALPIDGMWEVREIGKRIVELDPDDAFAHTSLSMFYQRKGMIDEAEAEGAKARMLSWKEELRKNPDAPPPGPAGSMNVIQ